ncbi:MAG: hypothetical protein JST00_26990 [Deltaproteobacteria bacterium]|nr:hypothetical protein [Deltaproteobacteria bacterium]
MNIKLLSSCVAALALSVVVSPSFAAPVGTAPVAQPGPAPMPKAKLLSSITAKNVAGVPGEKKNFEATLIEKVSNKPIAGKRVVFTLTGKDGTNVPGGTMQIGVDTTDASGKATVSFAVPELVQGNYMIKVSYPGDDATFGSSDQANLLVVKAITAIDLGNLIWGTYKNEPGSPYGTIIFSLRRTVDGKAIERPLQITVNGQSWTLSPQIVHSIALPQNATTWNVKVTWAGDGVYQPFEVTKVFHKP